MQTFPRANTQRILIGSVSPLARGILLSQDGEPAAAGGAVTASVYSPDGVLSGAPNRACTTGASPGAYTVPLTTAEAATLNVWRIEWSDAGVRRAESWHRIVGGFMFTRSALESMPGLAGQFTDSILDEAREWITNLIEYQTGAAWSPRFDVDVFDGRGWHSHSTDFRPVRAVRSVTFCDGDIVQDVADITVNPDVGTVTVPVSFHGVCRVGYEHGFDSPTESLRQAALIAAADLLNRGGSGLSQRTRSVTNEIGVVQQFSFPGMNHPTGIDFVDSAIVSHDQRLPSFG